jgi:phage tail protein X
MAIIQISKIQQRSGNLVDLPQLSEAQLGWANDAKRLFIGGTGNANTYNENIEVLTSYSDITFSQINGSEGNLNISNAQTGQILTYVASTNTWDNAGGNALQPGNSALYTGGNIHLGDVATLKIGGGAIGYVLETDGVGNLTWTPKSTITAYISAVTKANPGIVTTTADNFFTEGAEITITNVGGMVELNGGSFYVNVLTSNTFSLYSDSGLTVPVNTTGYTTYTSGGRAISSVGGSGTSAAGGSNTTIQFNDNNVIQGNAGFTFNKITGAVAIPGNVTAGNVIVTLITGTLTTAAQPNITSVGTLSSLAVTANANVGNLNSVGNVTASRLVSNVATGTAPLTVTSTTQVANLNVATAGVAGTVTTAAQPNITSVGTLSSLAVTGNVTAGNIYANSGTIGATSLTGTLTTAAQPNITSVGTLTSVTVTGNVSTGGIKTNNYYYANGDAISFAGSYSNSNVSSLLASFGSNTISTTGNITGGNVIASNFVGAGAGTPTIASSGSLSISATSGVTINNLISLSTGGNTTAGNITGNFTLTTGSRLQATYADLAEYYEADTNYEPGTVLEFSGDKEVTVAKDGTSRVAGVVSTNPAYAMNANCQGIATAIALQGRVPTKVRGIIYKGDMMISAGNGYARPCNTPLMGTVIGKALENFDGVEGIIEIAVGRL